MGRGAHAGGERTGRRPRRPYGLRIRGYREADGTAVRRIHESGMRQEGTYVDGTYADLEDIGRSYLSEGGAFLVAEVNGRVVGIGGLQKKGRGTGFINRISVKKAFRGRGIGTAILRALERKARAYGYGKVALDTARQHKTAQMLYLENGYRKTGTKRWRGLTCILYEKRL